MTGPGIDLKIAERTAIDPFIVMDVLAAANAQAASGADVIHLEVGEPGGGPPAPVLEAARQRASVSCRPSLGRLASVSASRLSGARTRPRLSRDHVATRDLPEAVVSL